MTDRLVDSIEGTIKKDISLEMMNAKAGKHWDVAVVKKAEEALGGEIPGEAAAFPKEVITDAAATVLEEKLQVDLPDYVLNGAKHHSRARAHRPRDALYCICGWPYQKALDNGAAMILTSAAARLYMRCEKCESH